MITVYTNLVKKNEMVTKTFFCDKCGEKIEYSDSLSENLIMSSPIACHNCFNLLPKVSYIEKDSFYREHFHLNTIHT